MACATFSSAGSPRGCAAHRSSPRISTSPPTRLEVAVEPVLRVAVAGLADIIRTKEAAGRAKDRAALPLLRSTLEETRGGDGE